ncbi:putative dCMP deaminase [Sinorhizobium phage phiM9]|uniref:Putative dCMP deaminase n=1 Tax=Sinorhizobium phage phiM9 TaxID=1636182 RepID=A0A0F6TH89_9CAUD|nr:putative dCMP deaminase [Sinorhizobium phage phiM9]AKE44796.1 putative dCMP deaminase [Sinorhizobium phage phiM9]
MKRTNLYFDIACLAALESKYDGTKVGAVIVRDDHVIALGWNGYPGGADDEAINTTMDRIDRLKLAIHAEENAILNAARNGNSAKDSVVFVTHKPCTHCLAKLSNAGVKEVRYIQNLGFEAAWCDSNNEVYEKIPLHKDTYNYLLRARSETTKRIYPSLDRYQIPEPEEAPAGLPPGFWNIQG